MITKEERMTRFSGLPWVEQFNDHCTVVGAGGIGSNLAYCLTRAGFKVFIFDHDKFEAHNMGGQFVSKEGMSRNKTKAVARLCKEFSPGTEIHAMPHKFTIENRCTNALFSCVDSFKDNGREMLFEVFKKRLETDEDAIFIDGRLEAECLHIYTVTKDTADRYLDTIGSDDEDEDIACSVRQTSHVAMMIAALMTATFTNYVANKAEGNDDRAVPFKQVFAVPFLYYTTED